MKTEKQIFVVQSAESDELTRRGIFILQQRIFRAETLSWRFQVNDMLEPTCSETDTSGSEERRSE